MLFHFIILGERRFKCNNCDKCFFTKSKMIEHKIVHTGKMFWLSCCIQSIIECDHDSDAWVILFDAKIYKTIILINNSLKLQTDLNYFCDWYLNNSMQLNLNKCFVIIF